jgi:capsular exopolysaccharide synthesis family protein
MQQPTASFDDLSSEAPKGGFNIGPYIRMVKRNILVIAGSTLVCGAAAFVVNMFQPPEYKAGFRVLVEPVTAEARLTDPLSLARDNRAVRDDQLDYGTQLEILQSPAIMRAIYSQIREEYPGFPYILLQLFLQVDRANQTKIIEVSFTGSDPELVQRVLEITAARYLQYSLEERKTRISEGVRFIDDQLPDLRERERELQDQLQVLQQRFFVNEPETESAQLTDQFRQTTDQLLETSRLLQEQREFYVSLQQQLNLSPNQAIAASALSEEPGYQALQDQYRQLEAEIALERARFTEESPTVQALRNRQQNIGVLMEETAREVIGPALSSEISNPEVRAFQNSIRQGLIQQMVETANQIQILEVREAELQRVQQSLEQRLRDFPVVAREFSELQRELDITTQTLDQLLGQRETLQLEAAQSEVPWELLSEPQIPVDEDGNPVPEEGSPVILAAGILAGALLGAGLTLWLEQRRDMFYEIADIEDAVPVPVLSTVPSCPFAEEVLFYSPESSNLTPADQASIIAFQESFSELFAGLRFQQNEMIQSLAICAAMEGDGTSTIALNLAQTLASSGKRVLIVDTNFRHPKLHDYLEVTNQKGLSDLLKVQHLKPEDVIQSAPTADLLSVLTSGSPAVDAPKQLGSPRMQVLSDRFAELYDVVIYDAPSLRDYMDTVFLSDHVDGMLMAIAIRHTKQSAVKASLERLKEYSIKLVGVVVNHPTQNHRMIGQETHQSTREQPLWMSSGVKATGSKASL